MGENYYVEPLKCTWYVGADPSENPHNNVTYTKDSRKKILPNILHTVGNTPLIRLNNIPKSEGLQCEILAKCEFLNPGGSIKDRVAVRMLEDAEEKGLLKPGYTVVEVSSGNTGIGLAMASAVKGYRCIILVPTAISSNKIDILNALGAEVVEIPLETPSDTSDGILVLCKEILDRIPNSYLMKQFTNENNPLVHYDLTAAEIYDQCDGNIDMMVLAGSSGGTITGIGRKLKELCPSCIIVGATPIGSGTQNSNDYDRQGMTGTFVDGVGVFPFTRVLDKSVVDLWIDINDADAFTMAKRIHQEEGILAGGSSGVLLAAAVKAARNLKANQRCVILLPDGASNYLSTFVCDKWMEARDLQPCINLNKLWWWDEKISALNVKPPVILHDSSTCSEALEIMEQNGCENLPVINPKRSLVGMITAFNIMKLLASRTIALDSSVKEAITLNYRILNPIASLGLVSRILEIEPFILVTNYDSENAIEVEHHVVDKNILGVLTKTQLLKYIRNNNK